MLPAGANLCGPNCGFAVCAGLCSDLRTVAVCAVALCGPCLCPDGRFNGDATILRSTVLNVQLGGSDVLPSPGFMLLGPSFLLCSGLLC